MALTSAAVLTLLWLAPAGAGEQARGEPTVARRSAMAMRGVVARNVVAPRGTAILGSAWAPDNSSLPHALVRLRRVVTGLVEATAQANERGEFTFEGVEGGTYLIELVDDGGRVLATGSVFTIEPGETVATFVRLPAARPWLFGLFGDAAGGAAAVGGGAGGAGAATGGFASIFVNTAATALTTAAGLGVTAVVGPPQPASSAR